MLTAGATQAAEPVFEPHEASYSVSRNGSTVGRVDVELTRREDGLWHYRFESEATAWYVRMLGISATESAWFQWFDDAILPLTYHHVSREPGADRFWQHRYDWNERVTETRTHLGELQIALTDDIVDPLTLRLAAAQRIAGQAPDFETFELPVIERDEIELQQYRFLREESLEVDGRCFDTAVFKRFRKPGSSRNYTAWHAESLDWVPVRIAHEDDGKTITLTLTEWAAADASLPERADCDPGAGPA